MKILKKRGLVALLLLSATVLAGCMGGGITNPGWTVVTAQGDVIYSALSTGQVVALDAAKGGEVIWSYPPSTTSSGPGCAIARRSSDSATPLDAVYGAPVVSDGLLLVTSFDRRLYAFDRQTGAKQWDFAAEDSIIGGVTLVDGVAYFGSADHRVYAVDLATQKLAWEAPFVTGNRVWGAPAVDATRVYIGSMDHYVYALDRQTGREIWRHNLGCSIPGSVTLADGLLFVGGVDKRLHVLKADDGSELWKTGELDGWVWGEALVEDGYVYFGTLGGHVYGLRITDGAPRWEPVVLEGAVRAGPVVQGQNLIVGTDAGRLYSIHKETGERDMVYDQISGGVLSRPVVVGDRIFVGAASGRVYALDVSRRDPLLWMYPPSSK